ncbi:MAG: SpoIID/LytB domain-containing protein [Candidatus Omnitrophota bacterium]
MKKTIITALLFGVAILSVSSVCRSAGSVDVRVRVADGEDKIELSVTGAYKIKAINADILLDEGKDLWRGAIIPINSGLKFGNREFKIYGIRIVPEDDATVFIGKKSFRGVVDIIRTEKLKLMVVNHLDIEDYLYGVLYHEMPHYWPEETLRAQAIAARTFAIHRVMTMRERDYDVTSDIYSQVYGGKKSERRSTTKAVDATRGKVLTYEGKIFPSYYHSISGDHTESGEVVFGLDIPVLRGRRCLFCRGAKGRSWKAIFSYKQMEERLNKYGIKVKRLSYIVEGKRSGSGRLETVRIRDRDGVKDIQGFKFRLALGPNIIRSMNFRLRITRKGVIFEGIGWGHGVGMCQWGAFGMAKKGYNYEQILGYYYPGSKILDLGQITL